MMAQLKRAGGLPIFLITRRERIVSLFGWLRGAVVGGPESELKFTPEEKAMSEMTLRQALDAHASWKSRVERKLQNPQFVLHSSAVASDTQCKIGKWLHGPAQKMYAHLPEYHEACRTHAVFHACAADVLSYHEAGNVDAAYTLLRGKFQTTANDSQLELVKLFAAIQS